jgi:hypothetical protein
MKSHERSFRPVGMGWWVDPRICQVRVADLRAYLLSRGWQVRPQPRPEMIFFEKAEDADSGRITVPSSEEFSDYLQRITEAITSLAGREQRYAVEVLDDILSQANAGGRRTG